LGLVQDPQVPASSLHEKIEPDSLELKLNEAPVDVVELEGAAVIVVSGAVVSLVLVVIVQLRDAGVVSQLPALSRALT
jgi:hypothetical protein